MKIQIKMTTGSVNKGGHPRKSESANKVEGGKDLIPDHRIQTISTTRIFEF